MTEGTGKGVPGIRMLSLSLAAALATAVGITLSFQVSIASGAGEHTSLRPSIQSSDPSLSRGTSDTRRFSKPITVTGEIWIVEAHDPKKGHPYLKLLRTRDDRMYGLYGLENLKVQSHMFKPLSQAAELEPGKRYEVSGRVDPGPASFQAAASADILVSDAKLLPTPRRTKRTAQLSETGKAGFIAAFVTWPGSGRTSFDKDVIEAQALGGTSLSASNGKFHWDPVRMVEVRLSEPLASCERTSGFSPPVNSWVGTVRAALEGKGFDLKEDYRALGIAFPEGSNICYDGALAYAWYSENCIWMETSECGLSIYRYEGTHLRVLNHELGHSLGLPHANALLCGSSGSPITIGYDAGCRSPEYGDRFDNMGGDALTYNSAYLDRLGWTEKAEVGRVPFWIKSDLEFNLNPFANNSGLRIIETRLPQVPSAGGPRSPGRLFVEYRTRTGLDAFLYPNAGESRFALCSAGLKEAVYLRIVPNAFGREVIGLGTIDSTRLETYLLDTNPQTVLDPTEPDWDRASGLCDAGLQPGDSWEDPTGKLKIDFLRRAADFSTATIRVRSEGAEGDGPSLELEKVGDGRGKIVIEETGTECEAKCTEVLEDEARLTIRAVPARGSIFRFWMGDCGRSGTNPTCELDAEWGLRKIIRAGFDPDPNFPRPDIKLSTLQLTPATLKVKAGKKARLNVQVTNSGLDEGEAKVSLSSSAPGKARVPGSVSFKVPGESSATGSFTVTTRKKQKGKVTITARLGSQTARANVVLAK